MYGVLIVMLLGVTAFAVIVGAILVDRYLEKKRDERLAKIVCEDVIPTAEAALEEYTETLMESMTEMTKDMMKSLKEEF